MPAIADPFFWIPAFAGMTESFGVWQDLRWYAEALTRMTGAFVRMTGIYHHCVSPAKAGVQFYPIDKITLPLACHSEIEVRASL